MVRRGRWEVEDELWELIQSLLPKAERWFRLNTVPPVRTRVGRPRRRPDRLFDDRTYDHDRYRRPPQATEPDRAARTLFLRRFPTAHRTVIPYLEEHVGADCGSKLGAVERVQRR